MPVTPEVLRACRKGDPQAQLKLYKQYYALVRSVCNRYSAEGQDLNALINDSFFRILTKINMYPVHIPLEAWIRKVTVNVVIDDHRRQKNYRQLTVIKETSDIGSGESLVNWNEAEERFDRADVEEMLKQLPDLYRKTFCLFVLDGFNHKEIAHLLRMKEGTSKWYVSEARRMLKELLHERLKKNEKLIRGNEVR
jgi:RNA polymerase sigma factor (sigma-70 family)